MARGWESKSAEEQVEQEQERRAEAKDGSRREMTAARAVQMRARQLLELKRERILSEKTSHPARRAALQLALKEVEAELQQLS